MRVVNAEQLSRFGVPLPGLLEDVDVEDAAVGRAVHRHSDSDGHGG